MRTFAVAAVVAWAAAPALAGGLVDPVVEPVVTPVVVAVDNDWGGFYVGAQLGYGDVRVDDDADNGADAYGAFGGIHGGFRRDFGRTVAGVELELNASDIGSGDGLAELDSLTRLKFMVGADLNRVLVYGTLGGVYANATIGDDDFSDTGIVGGIGMAYALTDSVTVGGELLYHRFSDFDDTGLDVNATTIDVRASFRF